MTLAVVIDDGVDALVAAHYLRNAGHDVTLVHGASRVPQVGMEPGWVPASVVQGLGLEQHGFSIAQSTTWARVPLENGDALDLASDVGQCAEAIRRVSSRDAARWPDFCARVHAVASALGDLYCAPPPDPLTTELAGVAAGARAALRVRKLGRQGLEDLLRLLPMSIADLLDEWFENDALKGALAAAGIMNLCQGTRSSGTAFNFLHHHVGSSPGVFRPPRSNARHVLRSLAGIHMREAEVARILTRQGRAIGVALATGETIAADIVVSGLDPAHTLTRLIDPGLLDPQLVRALRNVRRRGVAARLTFESHEAPGWSNLVIAPSPDYLERAYDDVKYGRVSQNPYIEAAAYEHRNGHARVEIQAQYVPYRDAAPASNDARTEIEARIRDVLSPHLPGIAEGALPRALTPLDLETQHRWPHGQPSHAEIALDQAFWMRPLPELAQYRTPLAGLYLCGPAMHPGTPVAGAAGANAAGVILRDLRKRR